MRRLRLAALLTGLGALVTCTPARALLPPDPVPEESVEDTSRSAAALAVLNAAASAAQAQAWVGTEQVVSMVSGAPVQSVVTVAHGPGHHSASDSLDTRLFSLMASHYDLRLGAVGVCDGRRARLVEARRTADGTVAGRFWIDTRSGLLVRREVLDERGQLLRRSDLVAMRAGEVGAATSEATTASTAEASSERLDEAELARFEQQGWPVPRSLPGSLDLYDARWLTDGVLQLAYSDGLSTLSLFVQRGAMPTSQAGVVRRVGGGTVWQSPGEPERVVWAAQGLTWTLVSDVSPQVMDEVLVALPHRQSQVAQDGLGPRVWRGMSRVGAWLNPFH